MTVGRDHRYERLKCPVNACLVTLPSETGWQWDGTTGMNGCWILSWTIQLPIATTSSFRSLLRVQVCTTLDGYCVKRRYFVAVFFFFFWSAKKTSILFRHFLHCLSLRDIRPTRKREVVLAQPRQAIYTLSWLKPLFEGNAIFIRHPFISRTGVRSDWYLPAGCRISEEWNSLELASVHTVHTSKAVLFFRGHLA